MVASDSRTALKWWIAVELRRLREGSGLTREQAARATKGSIQAIGHFETGRTLPGPLQLDVLLELYGVPERIDHFQELRVRAKRGKDWWVGAHDAAPEHLNLFLGLETYAAQIESWDAHVVPGLFQTRDTAHALMSAVRRETPDSDGGGRDTAIEDLVELRMERQRRVLDRDEPPLVWRVIAEPALRWPIGGVEVQREQLRHLLALAERPNIEIQVLPFEAGAHPGTEGTFTLLSAPGELENYPGCVYVEDRIRGHYYDEADDIRVFSNELNRLRVEALRPGDSLALIARLLEEL
ncbi:helix-turn-helix domain-containing protein [Pseudonocardia sp. HH130630-07]|uniref:helix-turn-helix domain-containing protein n=1 Tax=Pseudonocardia sp. HH130630-07 TaxID=1690815 RepID=UPI00081538E9|nr:helix-turn-helix transcriptional regulator [Pseudonocardia sp. HH130630-07]ANY07427.1 hypothetical protein AFB00_15265 [Pseudonocardia sp. HH130630-07]